MQRDPTVCDTAPDQVMATDARAKWDSHGEVQQLIEHVPELCRLYAALGYAAEFKRQCAQLLYELTALITAAIPDFAAFYSTVQHVQAHIQMAEDGERFHHLVSQERLWRARHDPFWQAILDAGQDQDQVLALLNRDAVYEQLPFIEQVPFCKDGQVVWRTPIEVSLVRKRPKDVERFSQLLGTVEALFTAPRVLLHTQARQEVLDEIARIRRDLQRQNGYLPTGLQALARKVSTCVQQAPNTTTRVKRAALDHFLTACVSVHHTYAWSIAQGGTMAEAILSQCRQEAQQHAQYYLHTTWMHTPWLTTYVLTNLLNADLAALSAKAGSMPSASVGRLVLICDEVASGRYDSDETIRRLRQQEEQGVYVHSLAYPLLRLQGVLTTKTGGGSG